MSDVSCMVLLHLDGGVFLSLVTTNAWNSTIFFSLTGTYWPRCWFFFHSGMFCCKVTSLWQYTYGLCKIKSVLWSNGCFLRGGKNGLWKWLPQRTLSEKKGWWSEKVNFIYSRLELSRPGRKLRTSFLPHGMT